MLTEDIQKHIGHRLGCATVGGKAVIVCENCGNMILVVGEEKPTGDSKIVIPVGEKKTVYFYYTGAECHGACEEKIEINGPVTEAELDEQAQDIAYERSQLESWWEIDED